MKKGAALLLATVLMLTGCGSSSASTGTTAPAETAKETVKETVEETQTGAVSTATATTEQPEDDGKKSAANAAGTETESSTDTLVIYFSRTGEQYTVGVIEKGNTAIVAEMLAEGTGAELFEVLPEEDYYPYTYDELTDVAKKEQNEKARPAYRDTVTSIPQRLILMRKMSERQSGTAVFPGKRSSSPASSGCRTTDMKRQRRALPGL